MRHGRWAAILVAALTVVGACQTAPRRSPSGDLVNRPMPASDRERDGECSWLRSEVARQQSLAQVGSATATTPMMAVAIQAAARRNIADLQSRYSQVQCDVIRVAPTAPAVPVPPPVAPTMTIEQCVAKCRQLTSRTDGECFDSCRH
jgi:hypothetical protein